MLHSWYMFSFGFLSAAAAMNTPEISLHLCEPAIQGDDWTFCCVTQNLHLATIEFRFPMSNRIDRIPVTSKCESSKLPYYNITCTVDGPTRVLKLRLKYGSAYSNTGVWSCSYYANSASLTLNETQVLTKFAGYQFANNTRSTDIVFSVQDPQNVEVYDPNGQVILKIDAGNVSFSKHSLTNISHQLGTVSFTLNNVTMENNGTYICKSTTGKTTKIGVTLIVLDELGKPKIIPFDVDVASSGDVDKASLKCDVQSAAAAPYFYKPKYHTNWIYPSSYYDLTEEENNLILRDIDCGKKQSQPVFCKIRQETGPWSTQVHYYPHLLCSYKNATTQTPVREVDKPDSDRGQLIAVGVIGMLGFSTFLLMFWAGKDRVRHCCGGFFRVIRNCCAKTLCRKCCRNVDDDLFVDYMDRTMRDDLGWDEANLNNILNVYSPSGPPVPLPPPPNRSRENEVSDVAASDDSGVSERGNSSPQPAGAEGVDRNVLIKEIESSFHALKKTLQTTASQVQVSRENLVDNVFNIYTDATIVESNLHVKMVGEEGSDWGGVSRDLFTAFWNEVSETHFRGRDVLVPYLPPHKMEDEYKFRLLGRILSHSTAILGYIPIPLCKSVVMVTILDTTNIEESALLEDFLQYLDVEDSVLVMAGLRDFSSLSEEEEGTLQELFIRNDMGCLLQESTFREQLLKMARNELCIKPRSLCELLREGIPEIHYHTFWLQMTIDHLKILNDRLKPTPEKVLACFHPHMHSMTRRRERVYGYFKDIVKGLSENELEVLLRFITGQACVPRRNIILEFSDLCGIERRMIAHTCSYTLEIPDTYESFEQFQEEFFNFIKSDILRFDTQ